MKTEKKVREVELPPIPIREITITNKSGHSLNVHALEPYGKLGTLQIAIEDGEERVRPQPPVMHIKCGEEKQHLYALLVDALPKSPENDPMFWVNGNMLLCKTADAAYAVADLLETLGITDCATTGYFHPEEDKEAGIEDDLTGYHYVDF